MRPLMPRGQPHAAGAVVSHTECLLCLDRGLSLPIVIAYLEDPDEARRVEADVRDLGLSNAHVEPHP